MDFHQRQQTFLCSFKGGRNFTSFQEIVLKKSLFEVHQLGKDFVGL
jgi:hypothetical protein